MKESDQIGSEIFAGNMAAGVFVVGLILDIFLPKNPKRYESV